MIARIKFTMIAVSAIWVTGAQHAWSADFHITVGEPISEESQSAIDQLKKCGTTGEGITSSDGKSSVIRFTRMYYSRDAHVFLEVVTRDTKVEKLMWQSFDPDDSRPGDVEFAAASEVSLTGKKFNAIIAKVEAMKPEAEQAPPEHPLPAVQSR